MFRLVIIHPQVHFFTIFTRVSARLFVCLFVTVVAIKYIRMCYTVKNNCLGFCFGYICNCNKFV
jgi:hypothetical protein